MPPSPALIHDTGNEDYPVNKVKHEVDSVIWNYNLEFFVGYLHIFNVHIQSSEFRSLKRTSFHKFLTKC